MTHPLSYFSLSSAAGLISYFSGSIPLGTVVPFGFWVIYLAVFSDGVTIGSGIEEITMWTALYTYFSAILLWAFAGAVGNLALWQFRFLSGEVAHYGSKSDPRPSGLSVFFFWLWFLLWQLGTLVLFEIEAPHYSFTLAGFLTVGLQAFGWIVLYFVLSREPAYFFKSDAKDGAWSIVLWNLPAYLIFGLVYVICQITVDEITWFTELWSFYATLIVAAFVFVWYLIAYAVLMRKQDKVPVNAVMTVSLETYYSKL
jgi:hypothetical protein